MANPAPPRRTNASASRPKAKRFTNGCQRICAPPNPSGPDWPGLLAAKPAPAKAHVQTAKAAVSDKYKVRKGDTLTDIAERFGTTVRELMDTNNLRNSVIHAGQILLVK